MATSTMSSHDEYSSDEEEDFSQSGLPVVLGFTDIPIAELGADEPVTIEETFIGGEPRWLHPELKPDPKLLTCGNCGKQMALLLQAYAPIDGHDYDRVIYVFGCKNTAGCSKHKGSVRAIRGISKDPERVAQIKLELEDQLNADMEAKLKLDAKPFAANPFAKTGDAPKANPFGANPFGANPFAKTEAEKPAETVAETAEAKTFPVTVVPDTAIDGYAGFLVYTEKERLKKALEDPDLKKYKHLIDEMEADDEDPSPSKRRDSTALNQPVLDPSTAAALDDKYFEQFTNTVGHNPGQVLRYQLGGHPLLYSGKDEVASKFISKDGTTSVPRPGYNPLGLRRFELQLMPKAIMDLEDIELKQMADILNGMAWGTIIVCTDVEDYMPHFDDHHVGYVEEWCGPQWEES